MPANRSDEEQRPGDGEKGPHPGPGCVVNIVNAAGWTFQGRDWTAPEDAAGQCFPRDRSAMGVTQPVLP